MVFTNHIVKIRMPLSFCFDIVINTPKMLKPLLILLIVIQQAKFFLPFQKASLNSLLDHSSLMIKEILVQ